MCIKGGEVIYLLTSINMIVFRILPIQDVMPKIFPQHPQPEKLLEN